MRRDLWFGRVFGSFLRLPGREPGHIPEGFADAQPWRAAKGFALAGACRDADAGLRGTSTSAVTGPAQRPGHLDPHRIVAQDFARAGVEHQLAAGAIPFGDDALTPKLRSFIFKDTVSAIDQD